MSDLKKAREVTREWSPSWLVGKVGYPISYVFGLLLDDATDAAWAALEHRFPNYRSNESLPLLGRDRGLDRGLFESDEQYAARLRDWHRTAKYRGSPRELVRQAYLFFQPADVVSVQLIARNGVRYTADSSGAVTRDMTTHHWSDSEPEKWCRQQLLIVAPVMSSIAEPLRTQAINHLLALCNAFRGAHMQSQLILTDSLHRVWGPIEAPSSQPTLNQAWTWGVDAWGNGEVVERSF